MAEQQIEIIITGNTDGLQKSTSKATDALNNVKKASGSAQYALTNLSRVASDAPFGFIAIQNNLDPLIQSFGQLQKETGSAGGALKALAGSLIGPAGIGLAFSIASAAFTAFQMGLFDSGEESKKAADKIRSSFDIITEATASVQGEAAKVQVLSSVVQDLSKSYEERNNALNQLKKINENYFGGLTLEKDSLVKLKAATEEYTNAIIAQAVVKGFEQEISKISQELFKQREEYLKLSKSVADFEKLRLQAAQNNKVAANSVSQVNFEYEKYNTALLGANNKLVKQGELLKSTAIEYENLQTGIKNAVEETLKFKPLDSKKVNIKPVIEDIRAFNLEATKLKGVQIDIKAPEVSTSKVYNNLAFLNQLFKELQENSKLALQPLVKQAELLGNILVQTVGPAFVQLFDDIMSGSKSALQAFGQAIAGVIKKLIAAAITAAIFAAIVSVAFPGSAAGGASFAKNFGSLFGQLSGLKFADGGIVSGPTRALIGEAGPEAVIPLHKLDSMIGGNQNIFVTGVLSGENIYLQQQRTSARRSRFV